MPWVDLESTVRTPDVIGLTLGIRLQKTSGAEQVHWTTSMQLSRTHKISQTPNPVFICLPSLAVRLSVFLWRLRLRWRRGALPLLAQLQGIQGTVHGKFDEVWTKRGPSADKAQTSG